MLVNIAYMDPMGNGFSHDPISWNPDAHFLGPAPRFGAIPVTNAPTDDAPGEPSWGGG
jgi:hypothetical protein